MAVEITEANYDEIVGNSDKPVVLDFWAAWCGPCKMVGPLIDEMHTEYEGKAIIGKVDVDNNPGIAGKFGVRNIPTIVYLKGGEVVDKSVGAVPKAQLTEKLDAIL
ncbi:thioredoxin [Crocinitomix catalasitica]|uniref:thioredoxin n=1 Tax=Crocinitomix catalasitica TaxID=184607 RepID=UPI0004865B1B|nr:thioredoxin [Crocinitomix catalasitica]